MPAGPGIEQLFGVAAFGHDFGQLLDILAARGAAGAVFSLSVGTFQTGGDARQLLALFGIFGSGEGERGFEQLELAGGGGIQAEAFEAGGVLGICHLRVDGALVDFGVDGFGIVGDVGILDPVGAAGIDIESEQVPLGVFREFARVIRRGFGRARIESGEERSEAQNCLNLHAYTVAHFCAEGGAGHCTPAGGRTFVYS